MRSAVFITLLATACSLDWSLAETKHSGSGGTSGGGTTSTGGNSGTTSGGTGGIPPSGGGAPGGAAGAVAAGGAAGDCASACLTSLCNSEVSCAGSTQKCCIGTQACASPDGTQPGVCMPAACVNGSDVQCTGGCPDVCAKFGAVYACCQKSGLCYDTSNTSGCQ